MKYLENYKFVIFALVLSLLHTNATIAAESGFSFSVKAIGGGWSGKNKTSGTEFDSDEGGQLGIGMAYQNGDFYTGVNFQGGEYTFEENAPDQVSPSGTTAVSNDKVQHDELDIVVGYYLSDHFSLFLDLKGIKDTWTSNKHEQEFGGLGLGATGLWPINQDWTVYGSVGFIANGAIKTNDEKIGEGKSSGVDIGAMYHITRSHRVMFGVKRSNYVYEFDSGDEQTHSIGGVYLGYSYALSSE